MSEKVLCKTYLKEALGNRNDHDLMLLVSPELQHKAETIVKELDLKLEIEPCERFLTGYWILF